MTGAVLHRSSVGHDGAPHGDGGGVPGLVRYRAFPRTRHGRGLRDRAAPGLPGRLAALPRPVRSFRAWRCWTVPAMRRSHARATRNGPSRLSRASGATIGPRPNRSLRQPPCSARTESHPARPCCGAFAACRRPQSDAIIAGTVASYAEMPGLLQLRVFPACVRRGRPRLPGDGGARGAAAAAAAAPGRVRCGAAPPRSRQRLHAILAVRMLLPDAGPPEPRRCAAPSGTGCGSWT